MTNFVVRLRNGDKHYFKAVSDGFAREMFHRWWLDNGKGRKPEISTVTPETYKGSLKREIEELTSRIDTIIAKRPYTIEDSKDVSILTAKLRSKKEALERLKYKFKAPRK